MMKRLTLFYLGALFVAGCQNITIPLFDEASVYTRYPALKGRMIPARDCKMANSGPETKESWIIDDALELKEGMKIKFEVVAHDDLTKIYVIPRDGTIDIPTIGQIHVTGRKLMDLREEIKGKLRAMYRDVQVILSVSAFSVNKTYGAMRKVSVAGMVRAKNTYEFEKPPTLFLAVNRAQGFLDNALPSQIFVLRDKKVIVCNYIAFWELGDLAENIPLNDGDIVIVPRLYDERNPAPAELEYISRYLAGNISEQVMLIQLNALWAKPTDAGK